jgi:penicillin amidase
MMQWVRQGRMLREWDCRYTKESQGAFLFERVYRGLLQEVFGRHGLGQGVCEFLAGKTSLFAAFHGNFDRILLAEESAWFGGEGREEIYRRVVTKALEVEPRAWREEQQMMLRHILFQGKLPRFLGFDKGPITVQGGRATIHQGTILHSRGRLASFTPSFHMVTDMGEEVVYTNLCGGPSDRRFSKWYASGVKGWIAGEYKEIGRGGNDEARNPNVESMTKSE